MKRYRGYQFKSAVAELTRKIAAELGVNCRRITWDAGISTAGTNHNGEVVFADVADDAFLHEHDLARYVGFAVHEMLHQKYTSFGVMSEDDQYLRGLHNAVEDAWIEHQGIDSKLTGNIGPLLSGLLDQMVGEANAVVDDWTDPAQYPFIFAVYLRRHANCFVPVPEGLESIIHAASERVLQCNSTRDTLRLAEWILSQLKNINQNGGGNGSKRPQETQSEPGQGSGSRLSQNPLKSPGKARAPVDGQGTGVSAEPTVDAPSGKAGVGSYSEDASIVEFGRHHGAEWLEDEASIPGRLRYEVKRLFDNSGIEEFQRNRRSGSVNVHALHKIDLTDKLFKRRHETDGIDSAVVICLDISSSMFDDGAKNEKYRTSNRIVQALLTTEALLGTLQKSQVSTAVVAFGSHTSVLKPFELHPTKAHARLASVAEGGGTNDYFAIRYAHKMLLGRPEQRKLCFVITDGQGRVNAAKEQVRVGERLGITTIGIGIGLDVSRVYPQSVKVNNVQELGTISFKQIKLAV